MENTNTTMEYFKDGDIVRVFKGPLLGYKGTVLSRWGDSYRIFFEANLRVMNYPCDSVRECTNIYK